MLQRTLIVSIDLGTSATTASHIIVQDSFTPAGELHRERGRVSITNVRDWPGGSNGDATGNVCVPTDLIYSKAGQLLLWGFHAQQYLDDPYPEIHPDSVFVVEHIKLLLQDPDMVQSTIASKRYRALRERLIATLKKQPEEVFEDFLNEVIAHIMKSANRKYFNGISSCKVELVLGFPSGWREYIHTMVAGIGARALHRAIAAIGLQNMTFGIENVYTVSETLCGVKEWLRDTIAEATTSSDLDLHATNLDELNEGDCFLPVDIGGGTGCMTPLRLVTKDPIRVDQLGPTLSLEVSGEAVEAEFEAWLRPRITSDDYPGDVPRLVNQICRKFREEKKDCGLPPRPGSTSWNIPAPRLRINRAKGFEKGYMKIDRKFLEQCFDPVLDILEGAIRQMLHDVENIKAIVFLGQFGASSEYLRKRMEQSDINELVKLRHSQSGKLNVVRGAISERLYLSESFVRKSQTLKSYGTLVTLPYYPGSKAATIFPNARQLGAVPFEQGPDGDRLKVVEWAIPKGTILENGQACDIGQDGQRHHTWPFSETEIGFEDIIVVSDELPPNPQLEGKSYTLWTGSHEQNRLIINNRKLQVQQIPFSWDLNMSQKLDTAGILIGQYEIGDLEHYWYPEEKKKGRRRWRLRRLHYDLVWDITEMQVKVHVRPLFPNPTGPLAKQLAKERLFEPHETYIGESRSRALERDIEISRAAMFTPDVNARQEESDGQEVLTDDPASARSQSVYNLDGENIQRDNPTDLWQMASPRVNSASGIILHFGPRNVDRAMPISTGSTSMAIKKSSIRPKYDGRVREGCFTCKARKKKCDCAHMSGVRTNGPNSCNTCLRHGLHCLKTLPDWARDPERLKAWQAETKRLVRMRKRRTREESDFSGTALGDPPATVNPAELSMELVSSQHTEAPIEPRG